MVAGSRRIAVAAVAIGLTLVPAGTALAGFDDSRSIVTAADSVEAPTIARINSVRHEHGLRSLRYSQRLAHSAEAHSVAMGQNGFFSHESSDGTVFWKRIARFYPSSGFARWTVGENLLWSSPGVSPQKAVELWLASPGHRKILLSSAWTQVGLAAVHVTNAPGVYDGLDVTIITADFGARS